MPCYWYSPLASALVQVPSSVLCDCLFFSYYPRPVKRTIERYLVVIPMFPIFFYTMLCSIWETKTWYCLIILFPHFCIRGLYTWQLGFGVLIEWISFPLLSFSYFIFPLFFNFVGLRLTCLGENRKVRPCPFVGRENNAGSLLLRLHQSTSLVTSLATPDLT